MEKEKEYPIRNLTVAQSVNMWLPRTMTWVYNQIKYADTVQSIVLARGTKNMQEFPWEPVFAPSNKYLQGFYIRLNHFLLTYWGVRYHPTIYKKALQTYCPPLLHSHMGNVGWLDLPLAQKHRLKQVVTFYGGDMSVLPQLYPVWRNRYKELFERADLFLCEGSHMASGLVTLGCPEEKIRVHRLGVDIEAIPYQPRSLKNSQPVGILICGTFREKKGIPYALEAVGVLKQMLPEVNVQVTLIGDASERRDKPEKQKIHEVIQKYRLGSRVRLLGFQPHNVLFEEAYKHHIFLSPSVTASNGDTEGGAPVTIIEMVASGIPVVSTMHCDIPGIIQHGKTGLLAKERDSEELAYHLKWLIEHPEAWMAMLEAGRNHVEEEFHGVRQGKRLANMYAELV
jgi:colanic acid/amylovoran biosynthesis glycosyltransferase